MYEIEKKPTKKGVSLRFWTFCAGDFPFLPNATTWMLGTSSDTCVQCTHVCHRPLLFISKFSMGRDLTDASAVKANIFRAPIKAV